MWGERMRGSDELARLWGAGDRPVNKIFRYQHSGTGAKKNSECGLTGRRVASCLTAGARSEPTRNLGSFGSCGNGLLPPSLACSARSTGSSEVSVSDFLGEERPRFGLERLTPVYTVHILHRRARRPRSWPNRCIPELD